MLEALACAIKEERKDKIQQLKKEGEKNVIFRLYNNGENPKESIHTLLGQ